MASILPPPSPPGSAAPFSGLDEGLKQLVRQVRLIAFDFDGVFTDNTVYVSEEGVESVRCWRSDGLGLRKLERLGLTSLIVSTEENAVVATRSRKLKITCHHGCTDKRATLGEILAAAGLSWEQAAFVGNDINDRSCLEMVGLPIVVHDAHYDVIGLARYRTRTPGGFGAVREVCDLFEYVLERTKE